MSITTYAVIFGFLTVSGGAAYYLYINKKEKPIDVAREIINESDEANATASQVLKALDQAYDNVYHSGRMAGELGTDQERGTLYLTIGSMILSLANFGLLLKSLGYI